VHDDRPQTVDVVACHDPVALSLPTSLRQAPIALLRGSNRATRFDVPATSCDALDDVSVSNARKLDDAIAFKVDRIPGFEPQVMWERTSHAALVANTAGGSRLAACELQHE
jgi:hypothetical protein